MIRTSQSASPMTEPGTGAGALLEKAADDMSRALTLLQVMIIKRRVNRADLETACARTAGALDLMKGILK